MNVSVVIPVKNEEGNIENCLDSLENQIQEGDEIIVVDGRSTDRTVEICKEHDGVRVFVPTEDSPAPGIGKARHIGTDKAENEIIAQTDADAIPPDGWVETVRLHFERDEELVVLWGSIEDVNGVPVRNLIGKFYTIIGGASGNNTAFRKSTYEELSTGYSDAQFAEDFGIIAKLSMKGKAKRDSSMVMRMNMDRKRYQTEPLVRWSALSVLAGHHFGGETGDILTGAGLGLGGTELTYEQLSDENKDERGQRIFPHHDQIGMSIAGIGSMLEGSIGRTLSGVGVGMVIHHWATEGISVLPTPLEMNTEKKTGGAR